MGKTLNSDMLPPPCPTPSARATLLLGNSLNYPSFCGEVVWGGEAWSETLRWRHICVGVFSVVFCDGILKRAVVRGNKTCGKVPRPAGCSLCHFVHSFVTGIKWDGIWLYSVECLDKGILASGRPRRHNRSANPTEDLSRIIQLSFLNP